MGESFITSRGYGYSKITFNIYPTELVKRTTIALSKGRYELAATTVGGYALFGGGIDASGRSIVVDSYSTSLVRRTPTSLSEGRRALAATTVGGYALFGGGYGTSSSIVVDAYDTSLVRSTPTSLSEGRHALAATTVGGYALFGGGYGTSDFYNALVDAYTTRGNTSLTVYPGTRYKLWDMQNELTATTMQTLTGSLPLTGYIKVKKANVD